MTFTLDFCATFGLGNLRTIVPKTAIGIGNQLDMIVFNIFSVSFVFKSRSAILDNFK